MTLTDTRNATIPTVAWSEFQRAFRWRQGEHLTAIAPTGAGKTTLFKELTPLRKYNLFFGTKVHDRTYNELMRKGFARVQSIDDVRNWDNQVMLWPKPGKTITETIYKQRNTFLKAMDVIARQGGWTLWVDEAKYLSEFLKLKTELTFALEQLRSLDSTVVTGAQRPSFIPPSVLSNSTHVFLWKTTYDDDAKRLADIGGIDAKLVAQTAKTLNDHEFLYIRARGTNSQIVRSQVGR
jgi:hypothetical protein